MKTYLSKALVILIASVAVGVDGAPPGANVSLVGGAMNPGPVGGQMSPGVVGGTLSPGNFLGSSAGFSFADLAFNGAPGGTLYLWSQRNLPQSNHRDGRRPTCRARRNIERRRSGRSQEQRHCGRRHADGWWNGRDIDRRRSGRSQEQRHCGRRHADGWWNGRNIERQRSGRSQEQRHCGRRHADGWWNGRNIDPRGGHRIGPFCHCHGWIHPLSGRRAITKIGGDYYGGFGREGVLLWEQ